MLLTLRSKNFRKSLIITSLLLVLSLSSRSFAVGACTPSQSAFEKIQAAFQNLDVRRTVQNMYTSLTTDSLSQILVNGSPEDLAGCAAWLQTQPPFGGGSYASPTKTIDLG
ncbi:MAG TPA: hypothetical protein VLI92_02945, partial [Candidatus Saccharimonadales bacterium]|nr:hypothetical protein [Candidatus Saccharimonadales bacterium]